MAFGGLGGGEDISFKVFLETAQASGDVEKFFAEFKEGIADAIKELLKLQNQTDKTGKKAKNAGDETAEAFRNISTAANSPIQAVKNLATEFIKTNPAAQQAAKGIDSFVAANGAAIVKTSLLVAGIAGLGLALKGLISVASEGDKFLDIADGFQENADKAGVYADALQSNLSAALNDQLNKTQLLIQANKLFVAGIDPEVFDDAAAAAKRYAEKIGIDATDALDQLTQGLKTGRESMLKNFGTVKDGVLVLDAFTQADYEAAKANRGVTDTVEFLGAKLSDVFTDFAVAVEKSSTLKLTIEALGGAFLGLATVIGKGAELAIGFLDFFADKINSFINTTVAGFTILGSAISDIASGQLPDMAKASAKAAEKLGQLSTSGKGASKVSIKLKTDLEGAGKGAKKLADDAKKAKEEIENLTKGNTDSLERLLGGFTQNEFKLIDGVAAAFAKAGGDSGVLATALNKLNEDIIGKMLDPARAKQASDTFLKEISKQLDAPKLGPGNDEGARTAMLEKFNKKDPTFFGFSFEGSDFEQSLASGIENAVLGGLQAAADAVTSGTDISVRQLSSAVGTALGAAIGAEFGPAGAQAGAILGGVLGDLIGQVTEKFNEDTSGTKARKSVDKFFADVFSADRLTVIVGKELERIKDFVVNKIPTGQTDGYGAELGAIGGVAFGAVTGGAGAPIGAAIGNAIGSQFGGKAPDSFATGTFDDALAAQQAKVQSFFAAVGTSFESLLGVSEEIAGQVGAILFNNIGGNLVNLQAVIQATGKSFEELGDAMFTAFFNGEIGVLQLQEGLQRLSDLFQVGIPGQIGAIDVAVQNLQISLQDDKGSRLIFNSLQAIGQEAIEAGSNLGQAAQAIASGLGLGAEKVALFLEAMKLAGIKSVKDLVEASNAQLAALASNIVQITQGGTPTNSTVQLPTNSITATPNFKQLETPKAASSPKSKGVDKAEQERKRLLEQLRNETERLVTSSDKYKALLGRIGENVDENNRVGKELRTLYDGQFKVLEKVQKAQIAYNKALEEGASGKKLGKLAKDLKDAKDAADKFGKSLNNATKPDLTEIVKLITNVNSLGEVLNAVGVSADALKEVIVQGFKAGKLSIQEANDKLKETTDLLGDGIPGKIGAITDAFVNLQKAGKQGGIFSLNAFKDIFVEFDELFNATLGTERKKQLEDLRKGVDDANAALQAGITGGKSPEEVDKLRKRLDGANKALNDFRDLIPKAELDDLREELKKTFDPKDVDAFFTALSNSGLTSLDDFKSASDATIIGILADLQNLGFSFASQVDDNTKKLLDAFNEQNKKLTDGKDLLQAQLDRINLILGAAGKLSPGFSTAGESIPKAFDAPLENIATQIGQVISDLAQFEQGDYKANVLLNVSTRVSDSKTQTLLDILFGDGSGSTIVNEQPGTGSGLTSAERKEFDALRRAKRAGKKLSAADIRRLAELNAKRGA